MDPSTGKKQYGMVIVVKGTDQFEREGQSFIDYDEIEPLLKGIDYIANVKPNVTKLTYFQAAYRTKGDLTVTTYNLGDQVHAAVESGYISKGSAELSLDQLTELRNAIAKAKEKLDAIR